MASLFPSHRLRQGAVGFVCGAARSLCKPDVHCHLLPVLKPFLTNSVIQIDKEFVVLSVLVDPVPQVGYCRQKSNVLLIA